MTQEVREGGEDFQPLHYDDGVSARQAEVEQDQIRLLLARDRDRADRVEGDAVS